MIDAQGHQRSETLGLSEGRPHGPDSQHTRNGTCLSLRGGVPRAFGPLVLCPHRTPRYTKGCPHSLRSVGLGTLGA